MLRSSIRLPNTGTPVTWIGANYWSRTGGPLMWRSYNPQVVDEELRVLRDNGLNVTRSFYYWPDFMPTPHSVDEDLCAKFADFLDRHQAQDMSTIPTFIVGHMSGENWDPTWRGGRDLYSDVWMVARQAWFAGEMVRRFKDHPAVAGWLVSNEMPNYSETTHDRETVSAWAQIIVDAVRAAGGTQPISLGDGAWGLENTGHDNGFSVKDSAQLCDFLGPHVYPTEDDKVRQHHAAAWLCELTGTFGRPVVLEEFGVSSDNVSNANAANYYRQVLHNTLLAGATGWIAWNNTDYDNLLHQRPYLHHAFEMHFGLTDTHGRAKPQLLELKNFADIVRFVDFGRTRRTDTDTAVVVSSYMDTVYPFTAAEERSYAYNAARQAWIAARLADLAPAVTRESDTITEDAKLYLVPSAKKLLAPTWRQLAERAHAGATVYASYPQGAHDLEELFGVEHRLDYGTAAPIEDDEVTITLTQPFGSLPEGFRLSFRTAGPASTRVFLPVEPTSADVIAVDRLGRPALMLRRVGSGTLILCSYPVEHMAALSADVNPEATSTLYDALGSYAGVRRPVVVADPRVSVDRLEHEDGRTFVWLVSQASDELTVKPVVDDGATLYELDGTPTDTVQLPVYGVRVLELRTARPRSAAD